MKDIKGYEGMYAVTETGEVYSLSRLISNGKGMVKTKPKALKPNKLTKGYLQVTLYVGKRRICKLVHRLVAETFLPNPNGYDQINHIDGNKSNNNVSNLEWCNNSMNQLHAYKIGLQKSHIGGKPMRKVILAKGDKKISFKSVAEAARFLHDEGGSNLNRVLKKQRHYNTIKGYKAEYGNN